MSSEYALYKDIGVILIITCDRPVAIREEQSKTNSEITPSGKKRNRSHIIGGDMM